MIVDIFDFGMRTKSL